MDEAIKFAEAMEAVDPYLYAFVMKKLAEGCSLEEIKAALRKAMDQATVQRLAG